MDIEPLFKRLEDLAPSFGRASSDIQATVTRGRAEDYKGVMQNCRLVLEALLRALVTDQLKQTPGKAMLDELITKFRQQANAGIIPTNILAHMGTVQAWGNLSAHDQATKLTDAGVTVGKGEVMASINSMVAILDWYAETYGPTAGTPVKVPSKPSVAAVPVRVTAPPMKKAPVGAIAGGVAVLGLIGAGGFFMTRPSTAAVVKPPEPTITVKPGEELAELDALYAKWNEPLPPASCRSAKAAGALAGGKATDLAALEATAEADRSAETWYLLARAQFAQKKDAGAAAKKAIGCPSFAAAYNLMGKVAVKEQRYADAAPSYQAALNVAPAFNNARFNLGMLHLQQQRFAEGIGELKKVTENDPKHADAHFFLGLTYEGQKNTADAKAAFCAALANGRTDAKDRCERP